MPKTKSGKSSTRSSRNRSKKGIGYAVIGLGHIAQTAVLPAFAHARRNSRLVALVSNDANKLRALARRHHVSATYSYDDFDECLANDEVDAVYIALPNNLHAEYSERAARAGVHVLCEKPMAVTEEECERMIRACRNHEVKLMIAYRLHFEKANLNAVDVAKSGKLGELKFFDSVFSYEVREGNIRTQASLGGGPVYDIGIYCINAARSLFRDEPKEVFAVGTRSEDPRFREIDETVSAVLRFTGGRVASFTCSYGAAATSSYRLVGTKGDLCLDQAYEYAVGAEQWLTVGERTRQRKFPAHDQFAAELLYFSDCILDAKEAEPSGAEGLADVRIIRAIHSSIESGQSVRIEIPETTRHPDVSQEINRPQVDEPSAVDAEAPYE